MQDADKCFVVMPFGVKPNGNGGTYNFDKVYRVIIQRAIHNVNMVPLRADETGGSRVIHADMFKDLRDRPVVLVDLSLLNPNVFYELGIRHVMSPTGTVLMANEETVKRLPFDIALSRTIPYKYDGEHLDWDEVERVVPQLQAAIEEARRGAPDSPVYAFLEQVLSSQSSQQDDDYSISDGDDQFSNLNDYQCKFADIWLKQDDISLSDLIHDHGNSSFGVRAIGYYGRSEKTPIDQKLKIAELLFNHEEYDMATILFQLVDAAGKLGFESLLSYGSAVSQYIPTVQGARNGLVIIERARTIAKNNLEEARKKANNNSESATDNNSGGNSDIIKYEMDYSFATQNYASMLAWIWSLTREDKDLVAVIDELRETIRLSRKVMENGGKVPLGRYAQNLLRLTMFLRIAENDPERPDIEKNFQAILALKPGNGEPYISTSYLRWYQVFILADMGKYDDAQKRAMMAISEDIKYSNRDENSEIGRRQYSQLRGFIEQYSRVWRDTKSIARISQMINSAHIR